MVTLALTPGCPAGIGPELFPRALALAQIRNDTRLLWCSSAEQLAIHAKGHQIVALRKANTIIMQLADRKIEIDCLVDDENDPSRNVKPGVVNTDALKAQVSSLNLAIDLAKKGKIDGIVTGPIRKAALAQLNGQSFDGQTEYLHHYLAADAAPPLMCFAGADFLLGLATIHVPLKDVSSKISGPMIEAKLKRLDAAATKLFKLKERPSIALFGLNPHAGEDGLIGDEEKLVLTPAVQKLIEEGLKVEGPVAADGFFGHLALDSNAKLPHAVLAMYHDQGLGPYKLLCKGVAVNITVGLKVARTSPAHGTADNLAGTYKGNAISTAKAIEIAEKYVSE